MSKPLSDKDFNNAVVFASENMHTHPDNTGMRVMCKALVMMLWQRDTAQIESAELRAQLAAANEREAEREAERDAVLRAVGFEGERLKLAVWAVGKGMICNHQMGGDTGWAFFGRCDVTDCGNGTSVMTGDSDTFFVDGNGVGYWWLLIRGETKTPIHRFGTNDHESAWAAFEAARKGASGE